MEKVEKIKLVSLVSSKYQVVLETKKQFKSDGEIHPGKKIVFRNSRAEVTPKEFELIQELPQYGVDFVQDNGKVVPNEPVAPKSKKLGNETEAENNGKVESLEKKVDQLTSAVSVLAESMAKFIEKPKTGKKKKEEENKEDK